MDHIEHKKICVPDTEFESKKQSEEKMDDRSKQNNPKFQCSKCGEKFTNMVWYSKHQGTCNKTMNTAEDPYAEFMKSEMSKSDLNGKSKPPETKPSESLKRDEAKSGVQESGPKPNVNNAFKEQVAKAEAGKGPAVKVEENVAKAKVHDTPQNSQSHSEKNKSEKSSDDPAKVRRFSAVIPDDPPTKFMDSPPKDIPVADCDHNNGEESDLKHSRGEDLTNGVTENGEKTKAEKKEKKPNGVNNLNKDSQGRPQNNVEPDDLKPKKAGNTITKTGKISKTTKPELSKNGLNKAAEEVITPKKTSTVELMEVDEPVESKAKPTSVKKKNDMPMGSLLKDLPTSGTAPQASNSGRSANQPCRMALHLIAIILAYVFLLLLRQSIQSLSTRDVDYV